MLKDAYLICLNPQPNLRMSKYKSCNIKTHGSESRGQGGSSKRRPDGLEAHSREYYTATRVVKIENAITKKP